MTLSHAYTGLSFIVLFFIYHWKTSGMHVLFISITRNCSYFNLALGHWGDQIRSWGVTTLSVCDSFGFSWSPSMNKLCVGWGGYSITDQMQQQKRLCRRNRYKQQPRVNLVPSFVFCTLIHITSTIAAVSCLGRVVLICFESKIMTKLLLEIITAWHIQDSKCYIWLSLCAWH